MNLLTVPPKNEKVQNLLISTVCGVGAAKKKTGHNHPPSKPFRAWGVGLTTHPANRPLGWGLGDRILGIFLRFFLEFWSNFGKFGTWAT